MDNEFAGVVLYTAIERWPLREPFRIAGHTFEVLEVLLVTVEAEGHSGRGEAAGVYYRSESAASMLAQVEAHRPNIETSIDRAVLRTLLPPGGARNALDCALWDLEAKVARRPVWQLAGLGPPRPLVTFLTCGAADPEQMATAARSYRDAPAIKLKLTGEPIDADRVRAVRESRPDVSLSVDANQGFTRNSLEQLMPTLTEARVVLIEQPFPVGQDALLDGFASPIPIAADESVQGLADIDRLAGRYSIVNIKLDKCGGLTEGLMMAHAARSQGLRSWVGNMIGTSLAMAPAFVLGQVCDFVELDGPVFLEADRVTPVTYCNGVIRCREELWGGAH